jgi:RNA polymerase sigma-70 factor (ECF subfamily)
MIDEHNDTDNLILNLLAADDTTACSLLYKCHNKAVYDYVKDFIPDHDAAKDIVQELFTAIWIKRHSLNLVLPLRKYLFRAAHNKAINYDRDRRTRHRLMGEIVNRSGHGRVAPPADTDLETRELEDQIKQALARLPMHARKTFLMSRKQGMTYKEIADHFHVTEKAIEKNMSKALSLLRQYLGIYIKILLIGLIE